MKKKVHAKCISQWWEEGLGVAVMLFNVVELFFDTERALLCNDTAFYSLILTLAMYLLYYFLVLVFVIYIILFFSQQHRVIYKTLYQSEFYPTKT